MRTVKDALRPPISEPTPSRPPNAELETTPRRNPFEAIRDSRSLRTAVLGAYAISAAASLYLSAETGIGMARADRSFSVEDYGNRSAAEHFPDASWIILPGIDTTWGDSQEIAWAMEPAMQESGQIAWAGYKNTGIDDDAIAQSVLDYTKEHNIRKINIYGHSMGGIFSLKIAQFFHEHPEYNTEVTGILLDSTPADRDDILKQFQLTAAASGGIGNIAYSIAKQTAIGSGDNLAQLTQSISNYLLNFDIEQATENLPDDLVVMYVGSNNDQLVNTHTAIPKWQDALGDKLNLVFDSSPAGHASPRGGNPDRGLYLRAVRLMGMATTQPTQDIERFMTEPYWTQPTFGQVPR